ncbi:MAG: LytTR family DNA-binding domain-containing protein [Flavobacteriales bacterium]|jgi:two-component system LytT family response regulator|nr:LytTR family DNA-binding domain-containing protein [Flavobacteriales bacterium]
MKAFIIDDEKAPRLILKHLLEEINIEILVIGESDNLMDGIDQIKQKPIDILFLDIEMPNHTGLEILNKFQDPIDFEIIFVTAYNQFAIQAFKLSAFDYLLKPLKKNELEDTLKRLKKRKGKDLMKKKTTVLETNLNPYDKPVYLLKTHKEEYLILIDEIISLEADGMYTHLILEKETITASKPLKEILEDLPTHFFRSHRSFGINLKQVHIPLSIKTEGIRTNINTYIPLSQRNKTSFLNKIKMLMINTPTKKTK